MNTPLRAGIGSIYEGGVRVAAFATWPGKIAAGSTVDEPLHIVDWYPTLLRLAGAPTVQKHAPDGLDIWPVLTQGAKSPHDALLLHAGGYFYDRWLGASFHCPTLGRCLGPLSVLPK